MANRPVVHILHYGHPKCGFTKEVPARWPIGHRWVGIDDQALCTCDGCCDAMAGMRSPRTVRELRRG